MAVTKQGNTLTLKAAAAADIAEGKLVGVDSSGNAIVATNASGAIVQAVGVAVKAAKGASNQYVAVATWAIVDGFTGLTLSGTVYLDTAGGVTQTRPTTAGTAIQPVGVAVSATKVLFSLGSYFATAQVAGTSTLA
ncbi:MAG TPA: hypothetical protein VGN26_03940 [Armatimonadota bacterium]|jgi:hypothetical protein